MKLGLSSLGSWLLNHASTLAFFDQENLKLYHVRKLKVVECLCEDVCTQAIVDFQ